MMHKMLTTLFVACLVALPAQALWALSLSDVELNSGLNQILNARVMLLAVNQDELSSLQVKINDSPNLQHELMENENGHFISITSRDVIKEPVLKFSLEVDWSKGHMIREYSLLIDPRKQ